MGSSVVSRDAGTTPAPDCRTPLEIGAAELLERLNVDGLPDDARLQVMAQNPADRHYWSRSIGQITAGEVRTAIVLIHALLRLARRQPHDR